MRIIRVSRDEFELEDGSVYPITPPLKQDMTPDEFQEHYDYAAQVVRGGAASRRDNKNAADDGSDRAD